MERRKETGLLARLATLFRVQRDPRDIKIYDSGVGAQITPGILYRLLRPQRFQTV